MNTKPGVSNEIIRIIPIDGGKTHRIVYRMEERSSKLGGFVGTAMPRKEDFALLTGRARFIDDLDPVPGLHHAAILRSPLGHAKIKSIKFDRALAIPGVVGVLTGRDVFEMSKPLASVLRTQSKYYPCAIDRVRYYGEPVAVVVAKDRYISEDALGLIDVEYETLPAVTSIQCALSDDAPILHPPLITNRVHHKIFRYGDPESAFASAHKVVTYEVDYPRVASTPMETYGVIAHYESYPEKYTVWSNFQGPFSVHALMVAALKVESNHLHLITAPCSGGSFGIKQGVYPYIVLIALASKKLGVPIKWIEDRLEHLAASSSGTGRKTKIEGAFTHQGELVGLRLHQTEDVGAFIRAPEPASLYRMQATLNGPYRVRNIATENSVVVTNKVPTGLNRGFGGPQYFFALERMMDEAAIALNVDPIELRRRNVVRKDQFPYECPSGSMLDSGDYEAAIELLIKRAGYSDLLAEQKRAQSEGRLFGIGVGLAIETSGANMAYLNAALTVEERSKGSPKSGGAASAVITMDPLGAMTLFIDTSPNGQGHETVAAQIAADELGVDPADIQVVTSVDTQRGNWTITSGNYGNRFSVQVATAINRAAVKVATKLRLIAAIHFGVAPEEIELRDGLAVIRGRNENISVKRLAAQAHWNPLALGELEPGIRETGVFSPPNLTGPDHEEKVRSSLGYAFLGDLAVVEVERTTGRVNIKRYISIHDVGNQLNPALVEGQVRGGFVHGLGAALFERVAYNSDGILLSSTFADYLCPTAPEIPDIELDHICSPSPNNYFGTKGLGDGCSMLAPVTIANAVANATGLANVSVPLTPSRVWSLLHNEEPDSILRANTDRGEGTVGPASGGGQLTGDGFVSFKTPPSALWPKLLDPEVLQKAIPGCEHIVREGEDGYRIRLNIRIAGIGGTYVAVLSMKDKIPPSSLLLVGEARGDLGSGGGKANVSLSLNTAGGTELRYSYSAAVSGKIASVGHRMLGAATRLIINDFFERLASTIEPQNRRGRRFSRWWRSLRILMGGK